MTTTYPELVGKRVELTYLANGDTLTETGTVKVANSTGVMFQKGQKSTLILNHEIQNHSIIETAPKVSAAVGIKPKRIDPVAANTVKRHLALGHTIGLNVVNGLSTEEALDYHDQLHYEAPEDFPHFHAEKNDSGEEQ